MTNVIVPNQYYVDILEKTNQQLSLWYNPYGIMIGILTVLVALIALSFAYILYRQGKDYKEAFEKFLLDQKKAVDEELKKSIDGSRAVIEEQINSLKETEKTVTGDAKAKIEKEIKKLEKANQSLSITPTLLSTKYNHSPDYAAIMKTYQNPNLYLNKNITTGSTSLGRICSNCTTYNMPGSFYCSNCGQKL